MVAQSNKRPFVNNAILASLPLTDLAAVAEFLEPVPLTARALLHEQRKHVEHVYFPESGVVSLRVTAAGSIFESALIGYRGAVGATHSLGEYYSAHQAAVLFPGTARRIRVENLRAVMNERPEVRTSLMRYAQALTVHKALVGLCGVRHNLDQRLACWLCLACDAMDSHILPVTHEYLACYLGLRRAGVTQSLSRFEDHGLINKSRGVLQIDDRKGLEQMACCCYSIVTREYSSHDYRSCGESAGLAAGQLGSSEVIDAL